MAAGAASGVEAKGHTVDFYSDEARLASAVADHLVAAFVEGGTAIVIATPSHAQAFAEELGRRTVDPPGRNGSRRLVQSDADEMLARIMVGDIADAGRFDEVVGEMIRAAVARGGPVRVFGEMVGVLWEAGLVGAALEVERFWNDLVHKEPIELYCAYHSALVDEPSRTELCALHGSARGADTAAITSRAGLEVPRQAREFVSRILSDWRCEQQVDDARLLVSELANNAVQEAGTLVTIEVARTDHGIRISVTDDRPGMPRLGAPGQDGESGRGLLLVAAVSERWGTFPIGGGKAVWADVSGSELVTANAG